MSTVRAHPRWPDILAEHAADDNTAARLIGQLAACEVAALAFCRLLERWGRGEAEPSTVGRRQAAFRRAAERAETALVRAGAPAFALPARARARDRRGSLVVRRAGHGRAAGLEPGTRAGGRASSPRCGWRRHTSSSPCSFGRSKDCRRPRGCAWLRTARRSGPVSSTCARTCSGAPSRTCARLPPEVSLTVVGSANLDLVARVERLPRPGETVTDAEFFTAPGGKGANQAVAAARLGAQVRFVGAVGTDSFAEEALAGLRESALRARRGRGRRPDRRRRDLRRRDAARTRSSSLPARTGWSSRPRSEGAVLCQLEIPLAAVEAAASERHRSSASTRPRPARVAAELVRRRRPRRREPLRARSAARDAAAGGADARRRGRRPARGREGGRARGRHRGSTRSTAPPPATRSPPASSSRCSRAGRARRRSRGPARPARWRRRDRGRSRRCRRPRRSIAL